MQTAINAIGLILDMVGVYMLFKTKTAGLEKVERITYNTTRNGIPVYGGDYLNGVVSRINDVIDKTNRRNDKLHKYSYKWFRLIVAGFSLQLISTIYPLVAELFK